MKEQYNFSQDQFNRSQTKWPIFENVIRNRFPNVKSITSAEAFTVNTEDGEKEVLTIDDLIFCVDAHVYLGNNNCFNVQTKTWGASHNNTVLFFLKKLYRSPEKNIIENGYYHEPSKYYFYPDFGNADYYMLLVEATSMVYMFNTTILKKMFCSEDVWKSALIRNFPNNESQYVAIYRASEFSSLYDMYSKSIAYGQELLISTYKPLETNYDKSSAVA